jgi:hypothetical protein
MSFYGLNNMYSSWKDFTKINQIDISFERFCGLYFQCVQEIEHLALSSRHLELQKIINENINQQEVSNETSLKENFCQYFKKLSFDSCKNIIINILKNGSLQDIIQLYDIIIKTKDDKLYDEYLSVIYKNVDKIISDKNILESIHHNLIHQMVLSDYYKIEEAELFRFVSEWIKLKSPSTIEKENILGNIRFGILDMHFMVTIVANAGLLTSDQIIKILADRNNPDKLINKERTIKELFWIGNEDLVKEGYRKVTINDITPRFKKLFTNQFIKLKGIKVLDSPSVTATSRIIYISNNNNGVPLYLNGKGIRIGLKNKNIITGDVCSLHYQDGSLLTEIENIDIGHHNILAKCALIFVKDDMHF